MNKNLQYTLSLKDLFTPKLKGAEAQTVRLDSKMSKLGSQASGLSRGFGSLGTAIVGAFSIHAVKSFGEEIIDAYKKQEYFSASLKTLLKGDAQAAQALNGQLVQLAKTTPFKLTDVQGATKQLLAYGFNAGELVNQMKMLGDVSAGVNAPLGDIAYLYGTLKTSGRVMQVDLRQFAGRGIPIYEALAKRLKVTTNEVNRLVHDGKIGFKDIEGAFKDMTKEGGHFFNLMQDQSKTLGGQISNLGDSWEQLQVNIGQSQSGILKSTVEFMSKMTGLMSNSLANSNTMDSAFAKYGVQDYTFLQKMYSNIPGLNNFQSLTGGRNEMIQYVDGLEKMYIQKSGQSKVEALKSMASISQIISNVMKDSGMGKVEKDATIAILRTMHDKAQGNLKLFDAKDNKGLKGMDSVSDSLGGTSSSLGAGTEVTGNRPQNMYITINKLVETLEVKSTTIKEAGTQIKETVSKVLLEAVNDVNTINNGK